MRILFLESKSKILRIAQVSINRIVVSQIILNNEIKTTDIYNID